MELLRTYGWGMADDLFRADALKAQSGARWGRPVGLLPVAWSRITMLLTLFVLGVVGFISTASFSRQETVRGRLRTTSAEARVYAPDAGTVTKLTAALGQTVSAGDILAQVTMRRQIDADTNLTVEALAGLARERSILEGNRDTALRKADLDRRKVEIQLATIRQERESNVKARELTYERIRIAQDRLAISQKLQDEGAASAEDGRSRVEALLIQRQGLVDLDSRISHSGSEETAQLVELNRIEQNTATELAQIDQKLVQIATQETQAKASDGFIIRAPVSGQIAMVQIGEGERVDPSRPMLSILPRDSKLQAELYVPSRAIAFIEPGKAVRIQYDSLPYQKFGAATGVVVAASQTTIDPQELRTTIAAKEPVYRVAVALDVQSMPAFGKQVPLQSGMELSADIILEKRKLIEWLLEPLYAAGLRMQSN